MWVWNCFFLVHLLNKKIFFSFQQAKSEEQIAKEKLWLDTEKVWLIHRGGFALSRKQQEVVEDGKIKLILDQTGETLLVDEDDIEKVKPFF